MTILGVECSAIAASCAILHDGELIAKSFTNVKLTHSETLMPMVENMLKASKLNINDIDCFAIANGPGSFTGIRIGISAIKGLAAAKDKICVGVSTLETMAYMHRDFQGYVCGLMDARCNQFYNAIFKISNGNIQRITEDRALLFNEIYDEIKKIDAPVILVGDGARLFNKKMGDSAPDNIKLAAENNLLQQADGVVLSAMDKLNNGQSISAEELLPFYLRLPQAERELKKRKEDSK